MSADETDAHLEAQLWAQEFTVKCYLTTGCSEQTALRKKLVIRVAKHIQHLRKCRWQSNVEGCEKWLRRIDYANRHTPEEFLREYGEELVVEGVITRDELERRLG